jgi:hypothetical protein
MSRRINVNPDQYKVAGRERQGENIVHEVQKSALSKARQQDQGRARKKGGAKKR